MLPLLVVSVLADCPAACSARAEGLVTARADRRAGFALDEHQPCVSSEGEAGRSGPALPRAGGLGAVAPGGDAVDPTPPVDSGDAALPRGDGLQPAAASDAPSADIAPRDGARAEERWPAWTRASSPHLTAWNTERLRTQRIAMGVLGSWAIANLLVGVAGGIADADPRRRSIYLGSAAWNVVNLAIAAFSLRDAFRADASRFDLQESQRDGDGLAKALLINMGLDAAYLAAAAFLWQRGEAVGDARLVGFGQALLLQGGFLAVFDTAFFLVVNRHLQGLWLRPIAAPNAVGLSLAGAL